MVREATVALFRVQMLGLMMELEAHSCAIRVPIRVSKHEWAHEQANLELLIGYWSVGFGHNACIWVPTLPSIKFVAIGSI